MSSLSKLTLELEIGQQISVRGKTVTITKIEYHERSGDIVIGTTGGKRKALTFSLIQDHVQG